MVYSPTSGVHHRRAMSTILPPLLFYEACTQCHSYQFSRKLMFRVNGYHYYYVCLRQRLIYAFIIMLTYAKANMPTSFSPTSHMLILAIHEVDGKC